MIKSSDIKKMAKHILRKQQGLHDRQIMHPSREWLGGLLVAILLVVGSGMWSVSTYLQNKNSSNIDVEVDTGAVVYRESMVEEALAEYERRRSVRESVVGSVVIEKLPVGIGLSSTTESVDASSTGEVNEEIGSPVETTYGIRAE